jgi:hypothetical protein
MVLLQFPLIQMLFKETVIDIDILYNIYIYIYIYIYNLIKKDKFVDGMIGLLAFSYVKYKKYEDTIQISKWIHRK